jgi:hypothetical protein
MNGFFYKAIFTVILGLGLLASRANAANGTPIQLKYAGTGMDTAVDTNGDGFNVSLTQANGQGTFGSFAMAITAEFGPLGSGDCAPGELDLPLLSSAHVMTFPDQSQLFGSSGALDGFLCVNLSTGQYYGQVEGVYVGGTGRFEGATGEFTSLFDGQNLGDPEIGFRSITGTTEGTVNRPAGGRASQNRRGKP